MTLRQLVLVAPLVVGPAVTVSACISIGGSGTSEFSVTYDPQLFDAGAYERNVAACEALPGVGEVSSLKSLPPIDTVTVRGSAETRAAARRCLTALPGANVVEQP